MANGNNSSGDGGFWVVIVLAVAGIGGYIYYQNNIANNSTVKTVSWLSSL